MKVLVAYGSPSYNSFWIVLLASGHRWISARLRTGDIRSSNQMLPFMSENDCQL